MRFPLLIYIGNDRMFHSVKKEALHTTFDNMTDQKLMDR